VAMAVAFTEIVIKGLAKAKLIRGGWLVME
jgi:hypothetical protein